MQSMADSDSAQGYDIGVASPPTEIMANRAGPTVIDGVVSDPAVGLPGQMAPQTMGPMVPTTDGRSVPAADTTSTGPGAADIASGWRPFPGAQTAQYGSGQMFNVPNAQPQCRPGMKCYQGGNTANALGLPPGAVILSERTVTSSAPQATTQGPMAPTQPMAPGTAAPRGQFGSSMPIMRPRSGGMATVQPGETAMQPSAPLAYNSYGEWFSGESANLSGDPMRFFSQGAAQAFRDADRLRSQGREAEAIAMQTLGIKHVDRYHTMLGAQWLQDQDRANADNMTTEDRRRMVSGLMDSREAQTMELRAKTDPAFQRKLINESLDDWRTDASTRALQVARLTWPTTVTEEALRTPEWRAHLATTTLAIQSRQFANAFVGQQAALDGVREGKLKPSGRDPTQVQDTLHLDNPAAWAAFSERYGTMYTSADAGGSIDERLAYINADAMQHFVPRVAAALSQYEANRQKREPTNADYEDAFARASLLVGDYVQYLPVWAGNNPQDAMAYGRMSANAEQRRLRDQQEAAAAAAAMQE
jgi:hypothetical protein